MNVHVKTIEV